MAIDVPEIVNRIIARINTVKQTLGDGYQFFSDTPPILRGLADVVETIPELKNPVVLWQVVEELRRRYGVPRWLWWLVKGKVKKLVVGK